MVFLKRTTSGPPRKKLLHPNPTTSSASPPPHTSQPQSQLPTLLTLLADCGCTLLTPSAPSLPSDLPSFRSRLHSRLTPSLLPLFLSDLSSLICDPLNLRRILLPTTLNSPACSVHGGSLARVLLLIPPLQLPLQTLLLEKLPEFFDTPPGPTVEEDLPRLIVNQFRWLDFLVDAEMFAEKLLEVASISPARLKKEIVGSLPEIVGERCNEKVVDVLEVMLWEDPEVVVPVLDALSNLNLDEELQDRAVSIALSCIKTIDVDHMPHLLRFLMMSATSRNAGRIVSEIREQLHFVCVTEGRMAGSKKMKGKFVNGSAEASILESLKSSFRLRNIICEAILKELKNASPMQDHKVIDIWLFVLIYGNGGALQKSAANLLKRKIVEGFFKDILFDQCIHGQRELVKENFSTFLSLSECLLSCKVKQSRDIGAHIYRSLFEEFTDRYLRQEVIGALVSHIGSGIIYEVNSSLEILILLASKYSHELDPFSSHIHGILDYLEMFDDQSLRKVYEIFCQLSMHAKAKGHAIGSAITNDLLMIVRKQVGNPDVRYRRIGIIGTLRIVSMLGNMNSTVNFSLLQKSNSEEAVELLKMSLQSCKSSSMSLILLYDELNALMQAFSLQPPILEWVGVLATEFEPIFLADLNGGKLPCRDLSCGLEGEVWMNLDGELSPVFLDILHLLSSTRPPASSLLLLPAHFGLLSSVEMSTNQGSLGGIDALLGCPFHLPSMKYFKESTWKALTNDEKKTISLSLYYAINWMRELVNVFSTQISGMVDSISQSARDEITTKLFKRLRNLVFLECLLNALLKSYHVSLPELYISTTKSEFPIASKQRSFKCNGMVNNDACKDASINTKKERKKRLKDPEVSDDSGKLRQPTIKEMLRKTGIVTSQELGNEGSKSSTSRTTQVSENTVFCDSHLEALDICAVPSFLEQQKFKLRPLHGTSLFLWSLLHNNDAMDQKFCCSDPAAELPLDLYLLRDFHHKLECLRASGRTTDALTPLESEPTLTSTRIEFFLKTRPVFRNLRKCLNAAIGVLVEEPGNCNEHWKRHSALAGNPEIPGMIFSKVSAADLVLREILCCYRKMLTFPDLYLSPGLPILWELLEAFQPDGYAGNICSGINNTASKLDYLYVGTSVFLEAIMDTACPSSFLLALEILVTQDAAVNSLPVLFSKLLERDGRHNSQGLSKELYPSLRKKLSMAAHKILALQWFDDEKSWKSKGGMMQKILRIYLNNAESTSKLLVHLSCTVLPQVAFDSSRNAINNHPDFPTLCPITFLTWYKVLHEVNIELLSKMVKDLLAKSRDCPPIAVTEVLIQLHHFVDVIVFLVSMCKTHDMVSVHALAIKHGGKFIDVFIKVFGFLEVHFQKHNDDIIQMLKELQKATRIIHALCSEAKESKRTMLTSKIPATKKSMESLLFRVKALLCSAGNGSKFWLGNLKHKDLLGQVVSSQVYLEGDADDGSPSFSE